MAKQLKLKINWQKVDDITDVADVPNGWIVRIIMGSGSYSDPIAVSMVFVPDPEQD
jgi:hypothetical protein